jgi:hypothetical protein
VRLVFLHGKSSLYCIKTLAILHIHKCQLQWRIQERTSKHPCSATLFEKNRWMVRVSHMSRHSGTMRFAVANFPSDTLRYPEKNE